MSNNWDFSEAKEVHATYPKTCPVCEESFEDSKPWGERCDTCRKNNEYRCVECQEVFGSANKPKSKMCVECELSKPPF